MPGLDDIVFGGAADTGGLPEQGTYYFHPDHIGSTSYLTDAAGHVVTRMSYRPYGEKYQPAITGLNIFNKKYTGQVDDGTGNDNGLLYYNARYYDPAIGRFISADSVIPDAINSQAYNRYMYVVGNPINFNDPTGHFSWKGLWKSIKDHVSGFIHFWKDKWDKTLGSKEWRDKQVSKIENKCKEVWNNNMWLRIITYIVITAALITLAVCCPPAASLGIPNLALIGAAAGGTIGFAYGGTNGFTGGWNWENALKGMMMGAIIGYCIGSSIQTAFEPGPLFTDKGAVFGYDSNGNIVYIGTHSATKIPGASYNSITVGPWTFKTTLKTFTIIYVFQQFSE